MTEHARRSYYGCTTYPLVSRILYKKVHKKVFNFISFSLYLGNLYFTFIDQSANKLVKGFSAFNVLRPRLKMSYFELLGYFVPRLKESWYFVPASRSRLSSVKTDLRTQFSTLGKIVKNDYKINYELRKGVNPFASLYGMRDVGEALWGIDYRNILGFREVVK